MAIRIVLLQWGFAIKNICVNIAVMMRVLIKMRDKK